MLTWLIFLIPMFFETFSDNLKIKRHTFKKKPNANKREQTWAFHTYTMFHYISSTPKTWPLTSIPSQVMDLISSQLDCCSAAENTLTCLLLMHPIAWPWILWIFQHWYLSMSLPLASQQRNISRLVPVTKKKNLTKLKSNI